MRREEIWHEKTDVEVASYLSREVGSCPPGRWYCLFGKPANTSTPTRNEYNINGNTYIF